MTPPRNALQYSRKLQEFHEGERRGGRAKFLEVNLTLVSRRGKEKGGRKRGREREEGVGSGWTAGVEQKAVDVNEPIMVLDTSTVACRTKAIDGI